ncbi:hypothetical protein [Pseudomonas syringae]|uniref:hypothetical protein n=1 Tax=Pseudomonas syringae TaxID=317 RepID=UPI0011438FC9|nr:hypothetical protein [Pseudomonas syringae]
MNSITKKSVLKGLIVTTVAVIGLQSMAFAAASKPSALAADGKYAVVQGAGSASKDSKSAPTQVAMRIPQNSKTNDPCRNIPDCD